MRALVDGGFADLHHPEYWDLGFVRHAQLRADYERIVHSIGDALDFFESLTGQRAGESNRVEFFASHEGLHLLYEQAQTRHIARQDRWYNLSTHMPWIGMRTAQVEGAHVEYFRGIANPIGVKIGPAMSDEWLQELVAILNPQNQPGRLTLIHRFGAKDIEQHLPRVIEAVRRTGATVLWCCDPMHGNTETTSGGIKTRRFENILRELDLSFRIHRELGSILGGVAHRADRRGCHRVHRRRARPDRRRPAARLPLAGRSAAELRAGARTGDADRRAQQAADVSARRRARI